jgi:acyl carrier protein
VRNKEGTVPTNSQTTELESSNVDEVIRDILRTHARLHVDVEALRDKDDLFRAGMTSLANVSVMLAVEDAFEVEFSEPMLRRSTFQSVSAIAGAVRELLSEKESA